MNEELGYSKYDYKNKEGNNSRNGYSKKTMHTNHGDMELKIPRDREGEFDPQVVKKYLKHGHSGHGRTNSFDVCVRE